MHQLSSIEAIAQQYREEGYQVAVEPDPGMLAPPLAGFRPDLVATRGDETVVVECKNSRFDLSRDPHILQLAEALENRPGWRLDVVVLEPGSPAEEALRTGDEPSDEQRERMLREAEELADSGHALSACVAAWAGLEAAMRRVRFDAGWPGPTTPVEMMGALYSHGFLSRDQFDRLRASDRVRSQVVHGLVPVGVSPDMVRFLTATARELAQADASTPAG